jgi:hypothetical protein
MVMRSTFLGCCILAALPSWCAAQEPAVTPFWLRPKSELDLRALAPADIKLVATPERSREFALLKVGNFDPRRDFTRRLDKDDVGIRVVAGGLKMGESVYANRLEANETLERIEQLPEAFEGLTLLQTNWWHCSVLDGRYAIVLATAKPCFVFVAIDENALDTYKQHGAPSWLQEFAPSGHRLATEEINFKVFVKQAPAGRIVLGPSSANNAIDWMYFAFFAETK